MIAYKSIPDSLPRRFIGDLVHFASKIVSVPVQRRLNVSGLIAARDGTGGRDDEERVIWPAVFVKAYARVCDRTPELRRALVSLPWPRVVEYAHSSASVAVEREYEGEQGVFIGRIDGPGSWTLPDLTLRIRDHARLPIDQVKQFRRTLALARLPLPLRRAVWWLGLNWASQRPRYFGTFGVTSYSSLGAESLHPISPLTTTMTYGPIQPNGDVDVRVVYDHRVLDGATVARALGQLDEVLHSDILDELRELRHASAAA